MKRIFTTKVIVNKRNNQFFISLPKKKLNLFKIPKKIKFKIEEIEWEK